MYAGILFNAELVIYRDRLQRHERLVMALTQVIDSDISNYALQANRPLTQSEIRNQFERILTRYSGPRIFVWLSQKNQPPLFPNACTFHSITETAESKSKLQINPDCFLAFLFLWKLQPTVTSLQQKGNNHNSKMGSY